MKTKLWQFTEGTELPVSDRTREGKAEWPYMVRIALDRRAAFRIVEQLVRQLQLDESRCDVVLFGLLEADREE